MPAMVSGIASLLTWLEPGTERAVALGVVLIEMTMGMISAEGATFKVVIMVMKMVIKDH